MKTPANMALSSISLAEIIAGVQGTLSWFYLCKYY